MYGSYNINTNKKTERRWSQMAKEHIGHFLEGQSNKWIGQSRNWTTQYMDDICSERRLRWLGHVVGMDHQHIARQALHWEVPGFKRGPGRPRTNWRNTVNRDLLRMGITWEEAEVAALNKWKWRRSVAQRIHLDAGWIKIDDWLIDWLIDWCGCLSGCRVDSKFNIGSMVRLSLQSAPQSPALDPPPISKHKRQICGILTFIFDLSTENWHSITRALWNAYTNFDLSVFFFRFQVTSPFGTDGWQDA